jgi:hypothetical protein
MNDVKVINLKKLNMNEFNLELYIENCNKIIDDINDSQAFSKVIMANKLLNKDYFLKLCTESPKYFRFEIELALFENDDGIEPIEYECFFLDEVKYCVVECMNMPGCITQGKSRMEAIDNSLKSLIECSIIRKRMNLELTGERHENPINFYGTHEEDKKYVDFIADLNKFGYKSVLEGPFHSILMKGDIPVTFSVLKTDTIYHHMASRFYPLLSLSRF